MECKTLSSLFSSAMAAVFVSVFYMRRYRKGSDSCSVMRQSDDDLQAFEKRLQQTNLVDGNSSHRLEIVNYSLAIMKKLGSMIMPSTQSRPSESQYQSQYTEVDELSVHNGPKEECENEKAKVSPQKDLNFNLNETHEKLLTKLGQLLNFQHPLERMPVILEHYRDQFEAVRENPGNEDFLVRLSDFYFALCMTRETDWYGVSELDVSCFDLVNFSSEKLPQNEPWITPLLALLKEAYTFCVHTNNTTPVMVMRMAESSRMYLRALNQRQEYLQKETGNGNVDIDGLDREIEYVSDKLFEM